MPAPLYCHTLLMMSRVTDGQKVESYAPEIDGGHCPGLRACEALGYCFLHRVIRTIFESLPWRNKEPRQL
jgi:hypothetical protein